MDDAGAVNRGQAVGDLAQRGQREAQALAALARAVERGAGHEVHDEVQLVALGHIDVDDRDEVRVIQLGEDLRLACEAEAHLVVGVAVKELQRETAGVGDADDLVHRAHRAGAERPHDLVASA